MDLGVAGGAVLLVAQVAAVAVVAVLVADRVAGRDRPLLDRALVALVAGIAVACLTALALGVLGLLSRGPLVAVHLAEAAVALRFLPRPEPRAARASGAGAPALVTAAAGIAIAALALAFSANGPSDSPDTLHYHVAISGSWYESHDVTSLPFADPGYFVNAYPSNGELLGTWLLAPLPRDAAAYLVPLPFGVLAVLAAAVVCRELGGQTWTGALAALAVMATPLVFFSQAHSLMTDLVAGAPLVAGAALVLLGVREPARFATWAAAAGAAVGIAVGSKYTALLPAAALTAVVALLAPRRSAVRSTAAFLAAGAPFAAFWFVRNAVVFDNPLFPREVSVGDREVFEGGRSGFTELSESVAGHALAGRGEVLERFARLTWRQVGPVLALVACALGAFVRRAPAGRNRTVVAGLTVAWGLAYLVTPTTGGGEQGLAFLIGSNLRYAVAFLVLGAAVGAAVLPPMLTAAVAAVALAWSAWKVVDGPGFRTDLELGAEVVAWALVLAAAGVLSALVWSGRLRVPRPQLVGAAGAALAGALVLALVVSADQPAAPAAVAAARRSGRPVALLGVHDVRAFMGRRFDVGLVAVGRGIRSSHTVDDADELDRLLAEAGPAVVAVGERTLSRPPKGWEPGDGWRPAGTSHHARIYVRSGDRSDRRATGAAPRAGA